MSIDVDVRGEVVLITINRPEKSNALDQEHYQALSRAWITVRDTDSIKVAIITGAGDRAFCAGADLGAVIGQPPALGRLWHTQEDQLLNRGLEIWKPVIAAVNGWCLGGGMTLLLATDIRIASTAAKFGLSEVKRGVVPGNGGTQRILQQLPHAIAMEILLTGDPFDANAAERWGLVNKVVRPEDLLPTAERFAEKIAANAPLAVQATKELALRSRDYDLRTGLRLEEVMNRVLMASRDASEGVAAFTERRRAEFEGS